MALLQSKNRRMKFIGCEIIYREACYLASMCPHHVDVEFLRKGLHDLETCNMQAKIQSVVDAVDTAAGYESILLGYARCNNGLVGIEARGIPLVIPRAHDCITFFFGSRKDYNEYFQQYPGTYYMTTGWAERNVSGDYARPAYGQTGVMGKLGLGQSWEEMVEKYGEENARYIMETTGDWMSHYTNTLFLKMGMGGEERFIEDTRAEAVKRNWRFDMKDGSWALLQKLFNGPWDQDFLIVPPGHRIVAREDENILDVEKV